MRFADPAWLLVGLAVVAALALVLTRAELMKSRAIALLERARLRSLSASPSPFRRWLRVVVVTLAVALGFVGLARPQKGLGWETLERNGIDLLLVVDTSRSMDSDDVKPTRLERAKLAIRDLVERFPGDRIGLVAFAGDAFEESPMTLDHGALLESVDALDTSVIARGGTNIGRGIDVAAQALASEPTRQKVMVLVTDGEDLEGQGLAEAKRAAADGIVIDTVGVGTPAGELVPVRDAHGAAVGLVRDEAGKPVRSRLGEKDLRAIAETTHGEYRPLGADGRGLDRLYDESLAGLTHERSSTRTQRVYSEWFEIPLALMLLGILIDSLLGRRWRGFGKHSRRWSGATSVAAAAGLILLGSSPPAHASIATAAKAYAAGRYDDAAKQFDKESQAHPKDARLAFNAGDAAYRAGQYDAAEAAFKRALTAADPGLQERVLYNEGDVLYRQGEAEKEKSVEDTKARWKAAIEDYSGAIALDPKDADAIYNRDLVRRKLKALEEQKKPEPPPKSDQNKDQNNGQKQDQKGGESKGKKDSSGQSGQSSPASQGDSKGNGDSDSKKGTSGEPRPGTAGQPAPHSGQAAPGLSKSGSGTDSADAPERGKLSASEARALLDSLRGEERRGVSHGTAAGRPTDDTPQKDW